MLRQLCPRHLAATITARGRLLALDGGLRSAVRFAFLSVSPMLFIRTEGRISVPWRAVGRVGASQARIGRTALRPRLLAAAVDAEEAAVVAVSPRAAATVNVEAAPAAVQVLGCPHTRLPSSSSPPPLTSPHHHILRSVHTTVVLKHTGTREEHTRLTLASPLQAMSQKNEFVERWLPGFDGHQFYTRTYPATFPRAVVFFVHGFAEHVARYEALHARFPPRSIAVFTFDQRGYGRTALDTAHKSSGASYAKTNWGLHFKDLEFFAQMVAKEYPGVPLFMMGQSMVRNVSARAVAPFERGPHSLL